VQYAYSHYSQPPYLYTVGMKKDILTSLKDAARNADLLSVQYTDSKGNLTERPAIVEEIRETQGTVLMVTEGGYRTFKIDRIQSI